MFSNPEPVHSCQGKLWASGSPASLHIYCHVHVLHCNTWKDLGQVITLSDCGVLDLLAHTTNAPAEGSNKSIAILHSNTYHGRLGISLLPYQVVVAPPQIY